MPVVQDDHRFLSHRQTFDQLSEADITLSLGQCGAVQQLRHAFAKEACPAMAVDTVANRDGGQPAIKSTDVAQLAEPLARGEIGLLDGVLRAIARQRMADCDQPRAQLRKAPIKDADIGLRRLSDIDRFGWSQYSPLHLHASVSAGDRRVLQRRVKGRPVRGSLPKIPSARPKTELRKLMRLSTAPPPLDLRAVASRYAAARAA